MNRTSIYADSARHLPKLLRVARYSESAAGGLSVEKGAQGQMSVVAMKQIAKTAGLLAGNSERTRSGGSAA